MKTTRSRRPARLPFAGALLAILFSFLALPSAHAQAGLPVEQEAALATVSGRVTDEHGVGIARAEVTLAQPASGLLVHGTTTDEDGSFRIDGVRPGRWTLRATYLGTAPWSGTIDVSGTGFRSPDVVLRSSAIHHPEVVVTAQRSRPRLSPVTLSSVDRAELERQPSMKDLPAQLAALPSVTWYSENGNGMGYTYLHLRGFGQRRVAVSVNGIPQNDPEEFNVYWINFFDLSGVTDDIQVQRGAGSALYGPAAIGGAVNIRANPYRPERFARAQVGYGAFGTRRLTLEANTGLLGGRWIGYGRVSRLASDGYRVNSWSRFWRVFGGVTRFGERSTLTVQGYGGPQEDGLAYVGIPKAANEGPVDDGWGGTVDRRSNYSAATGERERFHQPHAEVIHRLNLDDATELEQTLFWIRGTGYFDFDGTFRSADYLRLGDEVVAAGPDRAAPLYLSSPGTDVFFRAALEQWQVGWLPRLTLRRDGGETRLGLEARLHRSQRWGRIERSEALGSTYAGPEADRRVYSFRGEKIITSAFVSHTERLSPDWVLQGDLQATWRRYRVHDEAYFGNAFDRPYSFLNPRFGVTWRPEQPFSAYASVALASREPRLKDLYDGEEAGAGFEPRFEKRADGSYDTARPVVGSERVLDFEAGSSWKRDTWRAAVNLFRMEFRDEIVPSGGLDQFGVPRTGNADRTRHSGVEAEGAVRLAPGLDASASVTWSRNRFVHFTEFVTASDGSVVAADRAGNAISGFPDLILNAGLTAQRGGASLRLAVSHVGRQYVDNGNGRDADGVPQPDLHVDPFLLVDLSARYAFARDTRFDGLELALDVSNLLDDRVLMFGNVGYGTPQFFPAATRHAFVSVRYTLR